MSNKIFIISILLFAIIYITTFSSPQGMQSMPEDIDEFSFSNSDGYGLFSINNFREIKVKVLDNKSYAISPEKRRIMIYSKLDNFLGNGGKYARIRIYLKDEKGNKINKLDYGNWKFFFVYMLEDETQHDVSFEFNVTRFYYNPFIHGSPN